jgi:predicted ABC-type exoprotein transport system permease subunit
MIETFLLAQFLPGDLPFVKWEWAAFLRMNTVTSVLANIVVVTVLTLLILPLINKLPFFAADRNRSLLIVPVLIAIPLAFMAEYSREAARYAVAVRRVMANGMGTFALLWFVRVFFHSANSGYRMDPESGPAERRK